MANSVSGWQLYGDDRPGLYGSCRGERSCCDPEIPVNIVELGLIYDCSVTPVGNAYRASVKFTLTARGCGMGEVLKRDITAKLLAVPGVRHADVELVWDPPWSQNRISAAAKLQLGMA